MLRYKVFVINLGRSPERLDAVKSQLDAMNVHFERIEAVDGRHLSAEFIEKVAPRRIVRRSYHRALSNAEIACSLSHKKAWQRIIDDDLDFALILEDDVQVLDNFRDVLELLAELPPDGWDFIKLYALKRGGEANIKRRFDFRGHTFVTYRRYPLGFVGQAVSHQGAASLVRNLPYVTEPVDGQLKSWWEVGVCPFGLIPYCLTTDLDGQSDINPGGKLEELPQNRYVKIVNKIWRAYMRLRWTPVLNRRFREFTQSLDASAG